MPVIREEVGNFFKKAPNIALNPDEAVALGATLQAEALAGSQAEAKLLLDVIPLSLGIETYGGAVTKLLLRNSTLPTEAREVFTNHAENQTAFDLHVLQGERELVKDCRSLARFKLKGLTPAPPGYHRIEVIFRVDANGILNVKARDLRSQKSHEIEVRPSFGISDDELFQLLESAEQNALQDMHQRQLVDIRVEAETVIRATEKTLKNVGHKLDPSDLNEVKARLIDLKNAVSGANPAAIRKCLEDLDAVGKDLAELQVNEALKMALSGKEVETFNKK
jgi:molecular chaperone DnaK (HSP70)